MFTQNMEYYFNFRINLKFRRYGGIFSLYHRESKIIMLKEQFKKILINLGGKIIKYLEILIV